MKSLRETLNPEKALIFRITHRRNVPWILSNGLHCSSSPCTDPSFISIGNSDLIARRKVRPVPIAPGGTLEDYIPFYFTPFTPMLYNIRTGFGGIRRRTNDEIVVITSSLVKLEELGIEYVYTDRHAYLEAARFFSTRAHLGDLDYQILQERNFRRNPDDPESFERYQAEALVHREMPVSAILGIACHSQAVRSEIEEEASARGLPLQIVVRPGWYFL